MSEVETVLKAIYFFLPAFTSAVCLVITFFSLPDSISRMEISLKRLLLFYFTNTAIAWFGIFVYVYFPVIFTYLNPLYYTVILFVPVIFCHIIALLTHTGGGAAFPKWNYLPPLLIGVALLVWSLFTPFEVQLATTTGGGAYYPGYEAYSGFFLSKPVVRLVYSVVYTGVAFYYLWSYFKVVDTGKTLIRRPRPWIWWLAALSFSLAIVSVLVVITPRSTALNALSSQVIILILSAQHITILYNVIRRHYRLYMIAEEAKPERRKPDPAPTSQRQFARPLDKKRFEAYIRKEKPYLDPGLKMADVAEALGVGRTNLSAFVNKTYGVNFIGYMNRCRINEVVRLQKMSAHRKADTHKLAVEAGFASYRNYVRALAAATASDHTHEAL